MQNAPFPPRRGSNSNSSSVRTQMKMTGLSSNKENSICRCPGCGCDSSRRLGEDQGNPANSTSIVQSHTLEISVDNDEDDLWNEIIAGQEGVESHMEQAWLECHKYTMERWQHEHEDAFFAIRGYVYTSPLLPNYQYTCIDSSMSLVNEPADPGSMNHSIMSLPSQRPSDEHGLLNDVGSMFDERNEFKGAGGGGFGGFNTVPLRLSPEENCNQLAAGRRGSAESRG